jgi:hypothetical protein
MLAVVFTKSANRYQLPLLAVTRTIMGFGIGRKGDSALITFTVIAEANASRFSLATRPKLFDLPNQPQLIQTTKSSITTDRNKERSFSGDTKLDCFT